MSHARTQIRSAARAVLANVVATGGRVYLDRVKPVPADALPAVVLFVGAEDGAGKRVSEGEVRVRNVNLQVDIRADGSGDDPFAVPDAVLAEVEALFATAPATRLGGLLKERLQLESITPQHDESVSPPVAQITVVYAATYHTRANAPEAII